MTKKLYRSQNNKILTGLLGGLAEYFDLDASLIRLGFIVLVVLTGIVPFVLAYIIGALVVPLDPHVSEK